MASKLAAASEMCTDQIEARMVRLFARAICVDGEKREMGRTNSILAQAFRETRQTENFDAFVLAYRSCPSILEPLTRISDEDARVCIAHIPVSDRRLASRVGLDVGAPSYEPKPNLLTPREQEVLGLIRNGLTNKEIARTLWIEETTAKAHVRNAFRKLGARSRTEALLLFDQLTTVA